MSKLSCFSPPQEKATWLPSSEKAGKSSDDLFEIMRHLAAQGRGIVLAWCRQSGDLRVPFEGPPTRCRYNDPPSITVLILNLGLFGASYFFQYIRS